MAIQDGDAFHNSYTGVHRYSQVYTTPFPLHDIQILVYAPTRAVQFYEFTG